eukprot:scaffold200669_cov15-Prasinocladus_malaysianus.AAC.1
MCLIYYFDFTFAVGADQAHVLQLSTAFHGSGLGPRLAAPQLARSSLGPALAARDHRLGLARLFGSFA